MTSPADEEWWRLRQRSQEIKGAEPGKLPIRDSGFPIREIARAIVDRAAELGLAWRLVPSTVATPGPNGQTRVIFDGDRTPVDAVSMIGRLAAGARVFVMLTPPAGVHVVGFMGFDFPQSQPGEAIGRPRMILQKADFPVATNTLTLVPDMQFTVVPNGQYFVQARLSAAAAAADDVSYAWSVPSGTGMDRNLLYIAPGATGTSAAASDLGMFRAGPGSNVSSFGQSGAWVGHWEDILVRVGAVGGVCQLQFARTAASGGTATFRSNSSLVITRYR